MVVFHDELDEYKCPTCGRSNETCRCYDIDYDFGYWDCDGGYHTHDEYFDLDIYEGNFDEDLEVICEFNGRQLTRAEARELFGE